MSNVYNKIDPKRIFFFAKYARRTLLMGQYREYYRFVQLISLMISCITDCVFSFGPKALPFVFCVCVPYSNGINCHQISNSLCRFLSVTLVIISSNCALFEYHNLIVRPRAASRRTNFFSPFPRFHVVFFFCFYLCENIAWLRFSRN